MNSINMGLQPKYDRRDDLNNMRKFDTRSDEPRTGWDAFGIELAIQEGKELFVEDNEIWTKDKQEYVGKISGDTE